MSTFTETRNESATGMQQGHPGSASTLQSGAISRTREAMTIKAWVAKGAKQPLAKETVDLGPLGDEDVEVAVEYCGLCHSDVSVLNNEWGISQFPAVLGHEVIGRITTLGEHQGSEGRAAGGRGVEFGERHVVPAVHVGKSSPVPAGAGDDHRPSRRVCDACSRPLGVGAFRCRRS